MINNKVLFLLLLTLFAKPAQSKALQINLNDLCDDIQPGQLSYKSNEIKIDMPMKSLLTLYNLCYRAKKNQVHFTEKKNSLNSKWEVRLYFGFARTHYWETDIKVKRPGLGTNTIKDVQFQERHSGEHYNPAGWNSLQSAFQWIDEPTNRIELTLQKGDHVIYISYFHPKYFLDGSGSEITYQTSQGQQSLTEATNGLFNFQLSQGNLDITIGYGRVFKLLGKQKNSGLFITPRFSAGPTGSKLRYNSTEQDFSQGFSFIDTPFKLDGFTAQLGSRLEYKYKKLGVFIDASYISRWVNHTDDNIGLSISYNLHYAPVSWGVSYELFKIKRKKRKKR